MITDAGQRLLKDIYDRRVDEIIADVYRQESRLLLTEIQPGSGRLRVRRGFNRAYGWGLWWVDDDGRRSAGPFLDWSRAQAFADTMSNPGRVTDVAALAKRIEASRVRR